MLVGTPKLKDMQSFSEPELKELFTGMEAYLSNGVPLEIPAAIPIGQLGRIVATLQRFHALVEKVAHVEAGVEVPGMDQLIDRMGVVAEEARELLSAKPPEAPKVVPANPSRLIIPK